MLPLTGYDVRHLHQSTNGVCIESSVFLNKYFCEKAWTRSGTGWHRINKNQSLNSLLLAFGVMATSYNITNSELLPSQLLRAGDVTFSSTFIYRTNWTDSSFGSTEAEKIKYKQSL